MNKERQAARQRLKQSTRKEFENLIYEAKLTDEQEKIIRLHILKGWSTVKIAMSMSCCDSLIRRRLAEIYNRISKL